MALSTGTQAPDFTLKTKTADGLVDVSLKETLGEQNVVLLFFPFAFTSVCQNEMCSISAGYEEYEKLDAKVLGISVDSPFAQEAWAKANAISVTLLSDFNKEVASAYGVLYEDLLGMQGVAKRSAFVINKSGEIVFSWFSEDPHDLPPFDELKVTLK